MSPKKGRGPQVGNYAPMPTSSRTGEDVVDLLNGRWSHSEGEWTASTHNDVDKEHKHRAVQKKEDTKENTGMTPFV